MTSTILGRTVQQDMSGGHGHCYIIEDRTRGIWPGLAAYRGHGSRGYRTAEQAAARAMQVMTQYTARVGRLGGPDLRVVRIER